jgi:hypothetical protein
MGSSASPGVRMADNSNPELTRPDEVERQFAETLRGAAFIFEKEENGRFQGSILACRAVARFIYQRNGGAQLAAPFMQIAAAFEELERGGKPKLFSKKSAPDRERERSPERRQIHMLAAAALEVMVKLEPRGIKISDAETSKRDAAAARVARHVNGWPGMGAQQVTGRTIIAWRNHQRSLSKSDRKPFDTVVAKILAEPNPRKTVDQLLRSGPPGFFKS